MNKRNPFVDSEYVALSDRQVKLCKAKTEAEHTFAKYPQHDPDWNRFFAPDRFFERVQTNVSFSPRCLKSTFSCTLSFKSKYIFSRS